MHPVGEGWTRRAAPRTELRNLGATQSDANLGCPTIIQMPKFPNTLGPETILTLAEHSIHQPEYDVPCAE